MKAIYVILPVVMLLSSGWGDNGVGFSPPVQHPKSRYLEIWKNSPFELEAAPEKVVTPNHRGG